MKIHITLKDPDGVSQSIMEAVEESLFESDLSDDEKELIRETRTERIYESLKPWVTFGEYVTIEIDTEAGTASVIC